MTVDELMKKLRELKKSGKITGDMKLVFDSDIVQGYDNDKVFDVQTLNNLLPVTVKLDEPKYGPRGTQFGAIRDGRGKPKGTERALRIV